MRLRLVIAVVVLVMVVAIIAGTSRAASANDSVQKIRYRTHQVINPNLLDIAKPAGPSTGDELIEKEILFSLDGKRIGYDVLHFTVVTANFKTQTLGVIVVDRSTSTTAPSTSKGRRTSKRSGSVQPVVPASISTRWASSACCGHCPTAMTSTNSHTPTSVDHLT